MAVEDVFGIKGRGTVVDGPDRARHGEGRRRGRARRDRITTRKVVVTGVEMFGKTLDQGEAGDNVGTLLRGIEREEIERGQVLAKPG